MTRKCSVRSWRRQIINKWSQFLSNCEKCYDVTNGNKTGGEEPGDVGCGELQDWGGSLWGTDIWAETSLMSRRKYLQKPGANYFRQREKQVQRPWDSTAGEAVLESNLSLLRQVKYIVYPVPSERTLVGQQACRFSHGARVFTAMVFWKWRSNLVSITERVDS